MTGIFSFFEKLADKIGHLLFACVCGCLCNNKHMNFIKKTLLGLSVSILTITLLIFGIAFGLHQVFGTPTAIKHALHDSGFYDHVVTLALDKAQKEQATGEQPIPVDRQDIEQAIQKSISPTYLQDQTEKTLDSVYDWLHGKTPTLSFSINVGDTKTRLADGLANYTIEHLSSLPACPAGSGSNQDIDPFSATCVPAGVDINTVATKAKGQLLNSGFLKDGDINASSIKTGEGKTLQDQVKQVPKIYKIVVWAIYGAGLLALLSALGVIFLSRDKRSGIKKVAIIAIPVGVLLTAMGWLASFGVGRAAKLAKEPLQQSGVQIGQLLANDLRLWWMGYGILLLGLGIGALLTLHFIKPKSAGPTQKSATPGPEEASAAPVEHNTLQDPKPRPKPSRKLIQ